jgi:oxaloacetate decarboxylase gamma subunit
MFGMGFVFVFLALMVVVTNVMSLLLAKIQPTINNVTALDSDPIIEVDEKTRAIIEAAIKMHTQR